MHVPWTAEQCLDAMDRWASGCWMTREFTFRGAGRVDGLIVPISAHAHCMKNLVGEWFWDRPRLVAVEVKVDRSDFLRGLEGGQFKRYAETFAGLLVVTPAKLCKTSELPAGVGHCVVRGTDAPEGFIASCKRWPTYRDVEMPADMPWRLLFKLAEEFRVRRWNDKMKHEALLHGLGKMAGQRIWRQLKEIETRVAASALDAPTPGAEPCT